MAVPELHFQVSVPEDQLHFANSVNVLSQAGFKADEAELSERFGMKLRYESPSAGANTSFVMSAEPKNENEFAQKVFGKCAEKLSDLGEIEDPAEFQKKLDDFIKNPAVNDTVLAKAVEIELLEGYLEGLKNQR